jgi:uncharacterized integral membrane protein (TIGR00698 family)
MPLTDVAAPHASIRLLPPLAAAVTVTVISHFFPLLGPLLLALAVGAVVANSRLAGSGALVGHANVTKVLLRLGVVLIGLKLPIGDIASIGWRGVLVVAATVGITFTVTRALGARLGLDERFVICLAAGFSICGAAAIAAVNDAVRARQQDVAIAVAMVTLYGSAMILFVPWASHVMGLSDTQSAIWAGASIHEVAQVVAAAAFVGSSAVAIATTVKLGRVALLALVYAAAVKGSDDESRVPILPWFLVGFIVSVVVRSVDVIPASGLSVLGIVTTLLLAAGMFGLGLGFRIRDLWPVPLRAFTLAGLSTLVAAGVSLTLVVALY